MPTIEALGAALLALRREAGITQEDLGERVGTSNTKIADYEAGRARPSLTRLWRLLEVMGLDFVDFGYALRRIEGRAVPGEAPGGDLRLTPEQANRLDEEARITAYGLVLKQVRSLRGDVEGESGTSGND